MHVVNLLEKIHVNHEENQVSMIQFSDIAAVCSLVITQHLASFCGQYFFQIPAVPNSR